LNYSLLLKRDGVTIILVLALKAISGYLILSIIFETGAWVILLRPSIIALSLFVTDTGIE
jgi:hypothetical protein